jgi:hypothetical protein
MVRALSAFMEFCYLVHRPQIDEDTLVAINVAVEQFHQERKIFIEVGIRDDFSLPHQHSIVHYYDLITLFGAPNGVCSSITESKHIKAVKEPWRRSSHNQPLGQMLLTNQCLDKLAASRVYFKAQGMLDNGMFAMPFFGNSSDTMQGTDQDAEDVPGMTTLGDVRLARHPGMCQ